MGSVVSVSENTLNATSRKLTRRLTPKRMRLSPSPKSIILAHHRYQENSKIERHLIPTHHHYQEKLKDRTPSVSEDPAKAKKPFITRKFNKVVKNGETVSPEAVQLLFTNSPGSNIVPKSNNLTYGSVAGKKKSKKKQKRLKKLIIFKIFILVSF